MTAHTASRPEKQDRVRMRRIVEAVIRGAIAAETLAPESPVRVTWFATLGQDWCEVWRPDHPQFLQHRIHRLVGFDT